MMLNGALAGLVAITAEPLTPGPIAAMLIGSIGAIIMYFGTKMLESYGLDDVVGAIPVHMFAGIFGTLVVPLTNPDTSFGTQFIGTASVCIFSFVLSWVTFTALKSTVGLRISKAAEKLGTDKAEVGVTAYSIRDYKYIIKARVFGPFKFSNFHFHPKLFSNQNSVEFRKLNLY